MLSQISLYNDTHSDSEKITFFYSATFHCSWHWGVEWLVDAFVSEFMLPKESREKQSHQAGLWFTRSVGLTMIVESHGSVCTVEGTTVWLSHQKGGEAWESGMAHLQPMTINAPTKGLCWSSTLPPNSSWSTSRGQTEPAQLQTRDAACPADRHPGGFHSALDARSLPAGQHRNYFIHEADSAWYL